MKVRLCETLVADKEMKTSAPNIWRSLKLDSFISRRGQWEHEMITKAKVESAMKDIIEEKPAKAISEKIEEINEHKENDANEEAPTGPLEGDRPHRRRHHRTPKE